MINKTHNKTAYIRHEANNLEHSILPRLRRPRGPAAHSRRLSRHGRFRRAVPAGAGRVEDMAANLDTDASDHQLVLLRLKD
jgi:hypothetical protein